jgi:hypothetical protein
MLSSLHLLSIALKATTLKLRKALGSNFLKCKAQKVLKFKWLLHVIKLSQELSMSNLYHTFGTMPVSGKVMFKPMKNGNSTLLYLGVAREALHT